MANEQNLTPWKPGQSGNPSGRPRGTENSATRLRRLLDAVQTARHPVTKEMEDFTTLELMDAALIARAMKGDVVAYREVLDRLEGKVPQALKHEGMMQFQTVSASALSEKDEAALAALLQKLSPGNAGE